jgi:hypothetical protein
LQNQHRTDPTRWDEDLRDVTVSNVWLTILWRNSSTASINNSYTKTDQEANLPTLPTSKARYEYRCVFFSSHYDFFSFFSIPISLELKMWWWLKLDWNHLKYQICEIAFRTNHCKLISSSAIVYVLISPGINLYSQ